MRGSAFLEPSWPAAYNPAILWIMLRPPPPATGQLMPDSLNSVEQSPAVPERRARLRQSIRSLAYVDLGFGNGGIILNVSEGGLAVRCVTALMESSVPKMSFRPSASKPSIEAVGEIVWKSESNTMVGIRFSELPEESQTQIRDWIALEAAPSDASNDCAKYPFESGSRKLASAQTPPADVLPSPAKAAVADWDATSGTAASVIPIRLSDPETGNSTALIAAPNIVSIDAPDSPLPMTHEEISVGQIAIWNRAQWRATALVVFSAAVSLAAGWAVGRGIWNRPSARIPANGSEDNAAANAAVRASAGNLAIEVVDSSDRRWTVPFSGPSSASSGPVRQNSSSTPGATTEPVASNRPPLRIWMPSAPIVSNSARGQQPADSDLAANAAPNIEVKEPSAPLLRNPSPNPPAPVLHPSSGFHDGPLIHRVDPIYPAIAQSQHMAGVVKLRVQVAADGSVKQVEAVSGPRLLLAAAAAAVRQWRYQPSLLDGKPIEVEKLIDVQFHLQQ